MYMYMGMRPCGHLGVWALGLVGIAHTPPRAAAEQVRQVKEAKAFINEVEKWRKASDAGREKEAAVRYAARPVESRSRAPKLGRLPCT